MNGETWFLRCANCGALYQPSEGFHWKSGAPAVNWVKPKTLRSPIRCDHNTYAIERWNGTEWIAVEKKHE